MNKRENVLKILNNQKRNYIPSGFWIHFNEEVIAAGVDAQVNAHKEFADATNMDIIKIMNEYEFRRKEKVETADDWNKIKVLPKDHELFIKQSEVMRKTLKVLDNKVYTLGTIHGVVASLSHSSGLSYSESPEIIMEHAKENKEAVLNAIKATTENVINMLHTVQNTDVDGIYYAVLGAEKHRFTREFFDEFIKPYDLMVLNEIKEKKIFLHMCKDNVDLERFIDYPSDVVNWAVHEGEYSLADGAKIFDNKIILGGLDDRSGVLVEGSEADIEEKIAEIKNEIDLDRFILGADCTLPTEIDYNRIRFSVEAVK